ncbi:T-complex-associated testis-expressed protein 1 [Gaertneriomyces sp. JEL0708]|nr:T-complex-associated testis-expressed protein 1 [Gaertneriomyces sp. JEL0708]
MSADAVSEGTPSTDAQSQVPRSNSVTTNDHPPISEFEPDATTAVPELFEKQPTSTQLPQQPPSISDGLTKKERIAANRRVIAEDPEWNLAPVKKLVEMCLDMVINHFEKRPIRLEAFPKHHLPTVLSRLPTTLPLPLTAPLISRQEYWHRKARDTFAVCDVTSHDPEGKDWKRMFFERWAEDLIESYTPPADRPPENKESDEKTTDPETAFVKDLALASPYIHRLRIGQLVPQGLTLPPPPALPDLLKPKPPATAAQATPQPAPFVAPPQPTFNISPRPIPRAPHIDPGLLIPVPYLTDLTLTYSLRAISTQYRKEYFGITPLDATKLAAALPQLGSAAGGLRRLAIPRSGLDDEMGRVVIKALLGCPNLRILDLSHNQLSAPSARALAKLITNVAQEANHPAVTHLNLANNRFTAACADSLGHALAHPSSTLSHLDLTLNHLSDEGGCTLLTLLQKNTTLTDLNLAANDLRTTSLEALAQLLRKHPNMRSIDVSVNGFVGQDDGGRKLFEGLEGNKTMIRLELRQSGLNDKWAASIEAILDRNRNGSLSVMG